MKRVWVVDDHIPIRAIYGPPFPDRLDTAIVSHLVQNVPADTWDDGALLDLCRSLCVPEYDTTFFLSPELLLRELERGAIAPHAVIFDWEYPGATASTNLVAIEKILRSSFAHVQVYTHLGEGAVDPHLAGLRATYGGRLLDTKTKANVTADQLAAHILEAWRDTIAGDVADKVRSQVSVAVERSLIDMSQVRRGAIAALSQGEIDNLVQIVLSRVRDELGSQGDPTLEALVSMQPDGASNEQLRRLLSIWYYSFPSDQLVRRGDLIEIDGELGFVVTPPCDLTKLGKKAGRRLTWLRVVKLDQAGIVTLRNSGIKMKSVGHSIVAHQGEAGDTIIMLPNVPSVTHSRESLEDFALLCHAWENRSITADIQGSLSYASLGTIRRRCTLAEPFAGAVVAKIASVMSSPGTPDLPMGEVARLNVLLSAPQAAPP